jgi:hypothetical protein
MSQFSHLNKTFSRSEAQISNFVMASYTLYHFPFSLFSIMVRYAVALRGEPGDENQRMEISQKTVNLHRDENLSEWYLTKVNPKGQVSFNGFSQALQ